MIKQDIDNWKKAREEADRLEEIINDRVEYIINLIEPHLGTTSKTFYYYGAEECEMGDLTKAIYEDRINYVMEGDDLSKHQLKGWDYSSSIPYNYLFMSNADILKDVDNNK